MKTYLSGGQKDTFFSNWLNPLFFEAFNNKFQAGRIDRRHLPTEIRKALALAPYLNGGLFTENELDNKYSFTVPDAVFEMLFDRFNWQTPGFLERYNFTIREDSPFDQEVAVDPEMIGEEARRARWQDGKEDKLAPLPSIPLAFLILRRRIRVARRASFTPRASKSTLCAGLRL